MKETIHEKISALVDVYEDIRKCQQTLQFFKDILDNILQEEEEIREHFLRMNLLKYKVYL